MIGFRGASRYYSPRYREVSRSSAGRSATAARRDGLPQRHRDDPVLPLDRRSRPRARGDGRERSGARRGRTRGLRDVRDPVERRFWRETFASRFDGFSIGSNDLDAAHAGRRPRLRGAGGAVQRTGRRGEMDDPQRDREAHKAGAKVGLCGQAPSDHPEFAEFLVGCGIDSMSVEPGQLRRRQASTSRRPSGRAVDLPRKRGRGRRGPCGRQERRASPHDQRCSRLSHGAPGALKPRRSSPLKPARAADRRARARCGHAPPRAV